MLEPRRFLIKERVKFLAAYHTYDIHDAESTEVIGVAEEKLSLTTQLLRWFVSKKLMPTLIQVREKPDDALVFTVRRGWYVFRSRVEVHDAHEQLIGYFQSKLVSWSGGFYVYDREDRQFAEVQGSLVGFDYRVVTPDGKADLGRVTKKFDMVRDLFTSADTYMVEVNDDLQDLPLAKMLVLAAALATDMIFKSESRGTVESDFGR